jgi:hypothetical protein
MMMSLLTSIHVEVYAIVFVSSSSCSITRRKIAIFIYYFYLLLYSYLLHSCLTIMFIMFISSYWILDRCLDRTESVCSTFSYALSYYVVEYYLNIFYDERQAKYNLSLRLRNLPKRRETKNLFVLSFRIILSSICLQRTLFISSYLMPVRQRDEPRERTLVDRSSGFLIKMCVPEEAAVRSTSVSRERHD